MKCILNVVFFLTICFTILSCSTNYYTVLLSEDATVYSSADSTNIVTIIPKNTEVFLSSKPNKRNYKKIKWNNYSGWAHNPVYSSYYNYIPVKKNSSSTSTYNNYSSANTRSSGGSVSVKGYHRKDGTYVKPHTRSSPSRRR